MLNSRGDGTNQILQYLCSLEKIVEMLINVTLLSVQGCDFNNKY